MTTITTRPYSSGTGLQVLLDAGNFIHTVANRIVNAAERMETRWAASARESTAIQELRSLNDRELRDIAISRCDIPRIAREAIFER